jgi:hypothetical protein
MTTIQKPALLTRTEIEWLLGNYSSSKGQERYMRHCINRKIPTFEKLELPLLVNAGYLNPESISAYTNAVSVDTNASGLEATSLVGRGIANPDLNSNKVLSDKKDKGAGSGNIVSIAPLSAFSPRHFEPTCPFGHGISNPTPYQARRPPLGMRFTLKHNINVATDNLLVLFPYKVT